ncbi:MAG TPA: hypothetical protein VFV17_10730 [Usitatibacteraceae bacterium]|nr:hypothetical protein [Usitatibacteraceae bacterium]
MSHRFRFLALLFATMPLLSFAAAASQAAAAPEKTSAPAAGITTQARSLVTRLVAELASACPVREVTDRDAFYACRKSLFGASLFRRSLKDYVLWGRAPGGNIAAERKAFQATQFGPEVFSGVYAPLWMFTGEFELEYDALNESFKAFLPAGFRNELPFGEYPYPFWHEAKKWTDYEAANTLVLWIDPATLKITQLTFMNRPAQPAVARSTRRHMPTFDGKWMWVDQAGKAQPAPTLFVGLYNAANPHLAALDSSYRKFALTLRDAECANCHVPDNPDKMKRLVLLQTPLHAAAEIDRVIKAVRKDKMPLDDFGIEKSLPDAMRARLLGDAEEFAAVVAAARSWETARERTAQSAAPSPAR